MTGHDLSAIHLHGGIKAKIKKNKAQLANIHYNS